MSKTWTDNNVAVAGGVLGALSVSMALYLVKAAEIKRIAAESQTGAPSHALAQRIAAMQADLTTFATEYTTELATDAATDYLVERVGLTPRQMSLIERLQNAAGAVRP